MFRGAYIHSKNLPGTGKLFLQGLEQRVAATAPASLWAPEYRLYAPVVYINCGILPNIHQIQS